MRQKLTSTGFPISLLLVGMIYTSTKALQFLSVPVYTIFKNLAIIVTAYGEVLWFGGSVTASALFAFGLMVLSSVVAAWADIQHALYGSAEIKSAEAALAISTLNAGYAWMGLNVFCTSAYVLSMRKVIKKMNFKDWDSEFPVLFDLGIMLMFAQPCSTTTFSPSQSFSSAHSCSRTGPARTSRRTSLWSPDEASSSE